jgi:hypothetical protein
LTDRGRIVRHVTARANETEHLTDIVKRAAELAELVPEPLREAAFNRVFDQLAGGGRVEQRADSSEAAKTRRNTSTSRRGASKSATPTEKAPDPAAVLTNSVSRTDHPEVGQASRALDRALYLLRIAEGEHGIDGMTAPQIAKVLTDKFRRRVSRQAINQALDAAGDYVDRTPTSNGVVYRLMQPGEDYLDAGGAEAQGEKSATRKTAWRSGRRRAAPKKADKPETSTAGTSASKTRKRSGRGPKPLIEELIAEGFFSEPRAMGAIQERLRHKKGAVFKPTDLSPTLVRLLRQNKLDRERNESNQYEYSAPA